MTRFLSLAAIATVLGLGGLSLNASTGSKAASCDCCVDCAACCGDTCACPTCCGPGGCCVVNGCCSAGNASCSMKAGAPSCCSAK